MWEKRATSAEGKNYSNSRVLGYGQLGGPTRPCAKVLLNYARCGKVEMLLPNYTKWSGMSCGGKKTMMSYGREKGGVLDK